MLYERGRMDWVFLSHPYREDPKENMKKVDKICKNLDDVIPISPLHLFNYIGQESPKQRVEIMAICKQLITMCAEHNEGVCVYFYDYGKLSEGQMEEYTYCFNNKYKTEFREVE